MGSEGNPRSAEVEDDRLLAEELVARYRAGPGRWPVRVTDLLDPRSAFFRRRAAVPLPTERRRRRALGSEQHARWARHLGGPSEVEVRVQRDGIVGVIDLLEGDGPTELKTTARAPAAERLAEERGNYLDQLGLYCALTDRPSGRIVVVGEQEGGPPAEPVVLHCTFDDLPGLRHDAGARAERLRRAVRADDPSELPRCAWVGRGCPFEEASVCGCTGSEPLDDRWVRDRLRESHPDPEAVARWRDVVTSTLTESPPVIRSFRDLLYPRRAYYEQADPAGGADEPPMEIAHQAAYRSFLGSIEAGPPGELSQRLVTLGDPPGSVPTFRGLPFLIKTSRARLPPDPLTAEHLAAHYLPELAFRCAAIGTPEGWIFLDYLKASPSERGWRAVRVRFRELPEWVQLAADRKRALEAALGRRDPAGLPACPGWMLERCPYRAVCGCGAAPTPS
jgi:hypothetical protein